MEIYPLFDRESCTVESKMKFAVFERDNETVAKLNAHMFVIVYIFSATSQVVIGKAS